MRREVALAAMLLLGLPSCADVLGPLPVEPTATHQAAPPRGPLAMTEAEWATPEPGWRWLLMPFLISGQYEPLLQEVLLSLSARGARAVLIEAEYSSRGMCFEGEWDALQATRAHDELNQLWGAVAISPSEMAAVSAVEQWLLDGIRQTGFDAVRVGPRLTETVEVPEVPALSAYRPHVRVSFLVPDEGTRSE